MGADLIRVDRSEVRVWCTYCGKHQWTVTMIQGVQRLYCLQCACSTRVEFQRNSDGCYTILTDRWNR